VIAVVDSITLLRRPRCNVVGIDAAFVFGSSASGCARPDSDVDLFILEGASLDRRAPFCQITDVHILSGREVRVVGYTGQRLAERLGDAEHPGAPFVRRVLAGPKLWVAGTAAALAQLATAEGIAIPDCGDNECRNAPSTCLRRGSPMLGRLL
jgi:predicted nucleotidyltransferase